MTEGNGINGQSGKWAWIWIGYTAFLFIQPIMVPTVKHWSIAAGSFAVFLGIYRQYVVSHDRNQPMRFWMIGATAALGFVVFPYNMGASTFFVYAASFLPFAIEEVPTVLALFGLEAVLVLVEGRLTQDMPNALIAVLLMFVIGGGNILFAQQRRAECKLRQAQEENVTLAAVAERERIARDLHDVLGHTLSVITLKAELAARLLRREAGASEDVQRAAKEIGDVERTARTALAEVREAIGGYRARGLRAEIDAARRTLEAAGVQLICDVPPAGALRAQEETVFALALREAVTNIVRHARATECTLRFFVEGESQKLLIADNGVCTETLREGNGLRGMRERVEGLGGALQVEQSNGMRLQLALPTRADAVTA